MESFHHSSVHSNTIPPVSGFTGFAAAVEKASAKFRTLGIDAASIEADFVGLSKRIGEALPDSISKADPFARKTVDAHRSKLMRKLGLTDRSELIRYAIRKKLIEA